MRESAREGPKHARTQTMAEIVATVENKGWLDDVKAILVNPDSLFKGEREFEKLWAKFEAEDIPECFEADDTVEISVNSKPANCISWQFEKVPGLKAYLTHVMVQGSWEAFKASSAPSKEEQDRLQDTWSAMLSDALGDFVKRHTMSGGDWACPNKHMYVGFAEDCFVFASVESIVHSRSQGPFCCGMLFIHAVPYYQESVKALKKCLIQEEMK